MEVLLDGNIYNSIISLLIKVYSDKTCYGVKYFTFDIMKRRLYGYYYEKQLTINEYSNRWMSYCHYPHHMYGKLYEYIFMLVCCENCLYKTEGFCKKADLCDIFKMDRTSVDE